MNQHSVLPSVTLRGAHAQYLEQLSDQDFWQYAQQLAQAPLVPTMQAEEYLECTFETGRTLIPLKALREILPAVRYLAQLSASPHWMLGITAWRGESIAVVDLAAYLTQQPAYLSSHSVLLIAQLADVTLGLATTISDAPTSFASKQKQSGSVARKENWQLPEHSVQGTHAGMPVLQIPAIISAIVQQLRMPHE